MPKGKKFNAAEKHFKKKEEDYQRRIKHLENVIAQLQADMHRLAGENGDLLTENDSLKDWVDRLLTYTELSKEDIKAACEHDKKCNEALARFVNMDEYALGKAVCRRLLY